MGAVREISVSNTVNGRELPIYSVETEAKQVALSFDATWGNEYMKQILDVLDKYDVKATFFSYRKLGREISGRCKTDSACKARYRKS